MRRVLVLLLAVLAAATACTSSGGGSADPPPIRIGAIYPLSGTQGPGGVEEFLGVQVAAQLVNRDGGGRQAGRPRRRRPGLPGRSDRGEARPQRDLLRPRPPRPAAAPPGRLAA